MRLTARPPLSSNVSYIYVSLFSGCRSEGSSNNWDVYFYSTDIIQASDISHTMQHWHVYRKWNQNLFEELYVAYLNGRMEKDPAEFWYKGEFGFFDFYIIPLTRKLKECGVFGVSSDEYLNYAIKNRKEWEDRGEEVVAGMIEECHRKYGTKSSDGTVHGPFQARPTSSSSRQRTTLPVVTEAEQYEDIVEC